MEAVSLRQWEALVPPPPSLMQIISQQIWQRSIFYNHFSLEIKPWFWCGGVLLSMRPANSIKIIKCQMTRGVSSTLAFSWKDSVMWKIWFSSDIEWKREEKQTWTFWSRVVGQHVSKAQQLFFLRVQIHNTPFFSVNICNQADGLSLVKEEWWIKLFLRQLIQH